MADYASKGKKGVCRANLPKGEARFRFYEELNDHLAKNKRKNEIPFRFKKSTTVREAIGQIGIPAGEVDLILVNGVSMDFGYLLKDGDRVSVYPIFERFDISGITRVREEPLRKIRSRKP
jgi:hypothetical protein